MNQTNNKNNDASNQSRPFLYYRKMKFVLSWANPICLMQSLVKILRPGVLSIKMKFMYLQ